MTENEAEENMSILTSGAYNAVIENAVKSETGTDFRIVDIKESKTGAMHPAARFIGEKFDVFVKAGQNPFSPEQFRAEAKELAYIKAHTDIKTPEVYGVAQSGDTVLLIMEAVKDVKPETDADFAALGRGLAQLHSVKSDSCGFDFTTYLGIFRQDNTREKSWAGFFGRRRLLDTMKYAIDKGRIDAEHIKLVERLVEKLPSICPAQSDFSLLHGDPWLGNLMFDGKELVLIDPALYYGNREIDLTTVNFFCPVPQAFFDAYSEVYPMDNGFSDRADLWKLNQWLGHVALFGEKYLIKIKETADKYL